MHIKPSGLENVIYSGQALASLGVYFHIIHYNTYNIKVHRYISIYIICIYTKNILLIIYMMRNK